MILFTPLTKYLKQIIFFCCVPVSLTVIAQDKIDTAMNILAAKYPQERIYLAYDKNEYVAGETIRFKAFLFSAYHLSNLSSNLYVEMLDKKKQVISRKLYPIINGITEGNLSTSDSLPENIYYIRAFTSWMLNFNESFQYIHPIPVFNSLSSSKLKAQSIFSASAFVEGGTLLANKTASIAVRLYSTGKLPVSWDGYLVDIADSTVKILSFQSLNPSVAIFNFIPAAGKQYAAIIEDENKNKLKAMLPVPVSRGISLQTNLQDSTLEYMLDFSNMPLKGTYNIIGTMDNDIVYRASFRNGNDFLVHSFPIAGLPKGVLRLTLFDEWYNVMAERLCFIRPSISVNARLIDYKLDNKAHAVNEFKLLVDSGNSYSTIVMDANNSNPFEDENLVSAFWLTSEFTDIKNGSSYFREVDKTQNDPLDAILITEKYRRFQWEDVIAGKFPIVPFYKENFLSYNVEVNYRKKPLRNETLNLILFEANSSRQIFKAQTDSSGKFLLEGLAFEGQARLSYKSSKKRMLQKDIQLIVNPSLVKSDYKLPLPSAGYSIVAAKDACPYPDQLVRRFQNLRLEKKRHRKLKTLDEVTVYENTSPDVSHKSIYNSYGNPPIQTTGILDTISVVYLNRRILPFNTSSHDISSFGLSNAILLGNNYIIPSSLDGYANDSNIYGAYSSTLNSAILPGYDYANPLISPFYPDNNSANVHAQELLKWSGILESNTNVEYKVNFYNNDSAKNFRIIVLGFKDEETPLYSEQVTNIK